MMMTFENTPLYQLREWHVAGVSPLNFFAHFGKALYRSPLFPMSYTHAGRHAAAASELIERVTRQYGKPEFGITHTEINGKKVAVHEEYVAQKTFCNLIHFVRDTKVQSPKLLIVAPMSGHHATLLRGTVEAMLPHADVYITDWLDARNVPLYEGRFDMEDHLSYTIEFMRQLAPDLHVMAVCQPSVSVFAAAAIMNAQKDPLSPRSITLIGGPIDTRENPTEVCKLAKKHNLSWFESNLITRVPINHTGFMRRVYPGFMQLMSFLSLNLERHIDSHMQFFNHLVQGDGESAEVHRKFYDEYLSVIDLPAEFYLQSVDIVFQRHLLPKGEMTYKGDIINPAAINKTAMLCLEGSLDDISGPGQTRVAMDLTKGLAASKKKYHLEEGVGHYGIFNGRKFRNNVLPIIVDFMKEQGK
ncbi:MAG TPA: polyhydroxyalkanoate depolymerase [Rickettsiales bacterium]|nr:polyhydroxyalkanoate depolymerase [Rickettsiales bacterium]